MIDAGDDTLLSMPEILALQKHHRLDIANKIEGLKVEQGIRPELREKVLSWYVSMLSRMDSDIADTEKLIEAGIGLSKH